MFEGPSFSRASTLWNDTSPRSLLTHEFVSFLHPLLLQNDWWECWISPLPPDCLESWNNGGETTCVRGNNATLYPWVLFYAPLWTAILTVTINKLLVYRAVRNVEVRASKYSGGTYQQRSKAVANQGFWYCGAFYMTWIFPSITRLVQVINGSAPFPLVLVTGIMVGSQGFFNFLVYSHPRYKALRQRTTKTRTTHIR